MRPIGVGTMVGDIGAQARAVVVAVGRAAWPAAMGIAYFRRPPGGRGGVRRGPGPGRVDLRFGVAIAAATAAAAALLLDAAGGELVMRGMKNECLDGDDQPCMVLGLFALFVLFVAAPAIGMSLC